MASGHGSHSGGRGTLLQLLYWFHLLLSAPLWTRAEEADTVPVHQTMAPLISQAVPEHKTITDDEFASSTNRSQQLQWTLDLCPNNTCKNRCGSTDSIDGICLLRTCNCDMRCRLFHDCCPDFEEVCPIEAAKPFTQDYIEHHSHLMSYVKHEILPGGVQGIQWVAECPAWEEGTSVELCERPSAFSTANYLQHLPVVYEGFIYRNKYCAMCHGMVHSFAITRFAMGCDGIEVMTEIKRALGFNDLDKALDIAGEHCYISFPFQEFPMETMRFLSLEDQSPLDNCPLVRSGQVIGNQLNAMCNSYKSVIVAGNMEIFNNPHCALCSGLSSHGVINGLMQCGVDLCSTSTDDVNPQLVGGRSFELLVDITSVENKRVSMNIIEDKFCSNGYIMDDLKAECVPTKCQLGFVANGTSCVRAYKEVSQVLDGRDEDYTIVLPYTGHIALELPDLIDRVHTLYNVDGLMSLDHQVQCRVFPLEALSLLPEALWQPPANYECYIIKLSFRMPLTFNKAELRDMAYEIFDMDSTSFKIFVFNYDISQNLKCQEGRGIYSDDVVMHTMALHEQNVMVMNVGYTWPRVQVPTMVGLFLDKENALDTEIRYHLLVKVCIKDWEEDTEKESLSSRIKGILTLTGNIVSLVSLFLTLLSFCIVPQGKRIIRILLINLIIALFMSQLTFILAEVFETSTLICRAVAILQHYSWLAYFFFMHVTALEMAWRFRSLTSMVQARTQTLSRGHIACVLLYGWLGPLLLLIPSVVLDLTDILKLSPRYGMEMGCWLNNQSALLYFFVIPFSIIVSSNTLLILFTIVRIKISANHDHMLSQERSMFQINIRLSTLMGLSWLLGLVASYTQLDAIWYAFIVMNTLQGVILFFSFTVPQVTIQRLRASRAPGPVAAQRRVSTTRE